MLNHQKIYQELLDLVEHHSPIFVFNHISFDNTYYRVFFYNYSTYAKFLLPSAMECRGITFEVKENGDFIRLSSMPMQKFFNYKENAFTQGIENHLIEVSMFKEDGSLMSSFMHDNKIYLKSKGHLFSEQANAANLVLSKKEDLEKVIRFFENKECTVNLEYTAPDNQIVLHYKEPSLTILNVRSRITGEYIPYDDLVKMESVQPFLVKNYSEYVNVSLEEFGEVIKDMENIEGFVVQVKNQWIKFKTDWYCIRHNTIDIFNPFSKKGRKNLINAVLKEETDDLKQLIEGNQFLLDIVTQVEDFVAEYLEDFKQKNPNIDRKNAFVTVNKITDDGLQVKYIMNKAFDNGEKSHFTLVEMIEQYAHGSKFKKYNDFIAQIKNPDPETYKQG
jgi:T4 RnlA family RNA ligase